MNTNADYLVIGAGPAGLQLGYFFEQHGRDYLIIDRGDKPGNFFESMPRHRMLISINKVYTGTDNSEANLRWDWNSLLSDSDDLLFKNYSRRYFPEFFRKDNYRADNCPYSAEADSDESERAQHSPCHQRPAPAQLQDPALLAVPVKGMAARKGNNRKEEYNETVDSVVVGALGEDDARLSPARRGAVAVPHRSDAVN